MLVRKHLVYSFIFFSIFTPSLFAQTLLDLKSESIQAQLKNLSKSKVKTIYDPAYKKAMLFWAYSCKDLLTLSPQMMLMKDEDSVILEASDGYKIPVNLGILRHPQCYLADSLADHSSMKELSWKQFGHGKEASTPGPYYIIWQNGDIRKDKKPWPWALVALRKEDIADDALIRPKNPALNAGFKLFKDNCISCHSINLVGGKVGFEMNIPKNITEYVSFEFFSSFALAPESYRAESKMPAQKLSKGDLQAIWSYLQGKVQEKIYKTK